MRTCIYIDCRLIYIYIYEKTAGVIYQNMNANKYHRSILYIHNIKK